MRKTTITGVIITVCLVTTSLFPASAAFAATTESECIRGGGSVAAGAGCKFCIGGKFDLSEIRDAGKGNPGHSGTDQKNGDKTSSQSRSKAPADNQL